MKPIKLEDLEEENSYMLSNQQQQYQPIQTQSISPMVNAPLAALAPTQLKNINYPPLQHVNNFKYEPTK